MAQLLESILHLLKRKSFSYPILLIVACYLFLNIYLSEILVSF